MRYNLNLYRCSYIRDVSIERFQCITLGLDAAAANELLTHLHSLAATNRTVILTIHQPRLEIFHMFHRLLLLSDGKIAYYGPSLDAYKSISNAFLSNETILNDLHQNPADAIMDVLADVTMRKTIVKYYDETSTIPELVKCAINEAKDQAKKRTSTVNEGNSIYKQASWFSRMSVLETRASKTTTIIWTFYLPVIFLAYVILLGTVYLQQSTGLLIMSGYCVYSVASALFMFPLLHNYYTKALEVYRFEKADGAGRPFDLILQGFTRYVSIGLFPVIGCSCILYLLLVNIKYWSASVFFQLIIVGMALNQTWIALLIFVLNAAPSKAIRISPVISSIAGFSSGFFIPREQTPYPYYLLFYINPNYFGFSASANLILSSFNENCSLNVSSLGCFLQSGDYILTAYNFDDVRPYMNIACLILMTVIFLICAIFSNWINHSYLIKKILNFNLCRWKKKLKPTNPQDSLQFTNLHRPLPDISLQNKLLQDTSQQVSLQNTTVKTKWQKAASKAVEKTDDYFTIDNTVFTPGQTFANVVLKVMEQQNIRDFKNDLRKRKNMLKKQVQDEIELRAAIKWRERTQSSKRKLQQQTEQPLLIVAEGSDSSGELNAERNLDEHQLEQDIRKLLMTGMNKNDHSTSPV
jgi:hypothetical protein